jgi:hypothetical protein
MLRGGDGSGLLADKPDEGHADDQPEGAEDGETEDAGDAVGKELLHGITFRRGSIKRRVFCAKTLTNGLGWSWFEVHV